MSVQKKTLDTSVATWFVVTVIGQWLFAAYTLLFYGKALLKGQPKNWNTVLPNGYVAGDLTGNIIVGIHLFLAVIIIIGGPLQIYPRLRAYAPSFHRWTGRVYIIIAFFMSLSGLYMVWFRGSVGGFTQHISISLNALLIMVAAINTIRNAIARNFSEHRKWAIRLFLVVSGVWFFRVGLFFWLVIHKAPVGFNPKTFEGPFLSLLSFSQYLLPLALFELYLKAQKTTNKNLEFITAGILFLVSLIMTVGILTISISKWVPKMIN